MPDTHAAVAQVGGGRGRRMGAAPAWDGRCAQSACARAVLCLTVRQESSQVAVVLVGTAATSGWMGQPLASKTETVVTTARFTS